MRVLTFLGAVVAAIASIMYMLESHLEKFYIFDPTDLHTLSQSAIAAHGNDTRAVVDYITSHLAQSHPNHVNTHEEWIFNNAGGAMGAMHIIHASITEYLIVFGSALGTEGHSGRHTADDYFTILRGEQLAWKAGAFEPERYPQGSMHLMKRGEVKQYGMKDTTWALEYARGWIPPMLFFGFADSKFEGGDGGEDGCADDGNSFFEYAGLFDAVEDGGGYGEGDAGEFGEREVVVGGVGDDRSGEDGDVALGAVEVVVKSFGTQTAGRGTGVSPC